jgi:hypothetical protein
MEATRVDLISDITHQNMDGGVLRFPAAFWPLETNSIYIIISEFRIRNGVYGVVLSLVIANQAAPRRAICWSPVW